MNNHSTRVSANNFTDKLEDFLTKKNIQIWSSSLVIGSILFYLVFGLSANTERPVWYRVAAVALQNMALLVSALLCLRNGLNRRMPIGSNTWTFLSVGLISYFCGNVFFSAWEVLWGLNSAGSLGDPFFVIFYTCTPIAMLLTIARKKVRLEAYQWSFLVAAASLVSLIVVVVTIFIPPVNVTTNTSPNPVVQLVDNSSKEQLSQQSNGSQSSSSSTPVIPDRKTLKEDTSESVPTWVLEIDRVIKPYANNLNYFYVWSDVILFTIATAIVMGLWGVKLHRAWIINSLAVTCYYVADIWFAYAANHIENYQSGFLLEIFWTFGAVLFGLAAATEFDIMLTRERNQKDLDMGTPPDVF